MNTTEQQSDLYRSQLTSTPRADCFCLKICSVFFFGSLSVLMIRSAIQTEKYFYFSDPCSAELVVSGWLHDFVGDEKLPSYIGDYDRPY